MADVLKLDLSSTSVRPRIDAARLTFPYPFFTTEAFYAYVLQYTIEHGYTFDIATFSSSLIGASFFQYKNIRRLVYSCGQPPPIKTAKQVDNNHAKFYIGYDKNQIPVIAFIGSLNLVASGSVELVYVITKDTEIQSLLTIFNQLYNA